jgi:hypothetical protein
MHPSSASNIHYNTTHLGKSFQPGDDTQVLSLHLPQGVAEVVSKEHYTALHCTVLIFTLP